MSTDEVSKSGLFLLVVSNEVRRKLGPEGQLAVGQFSGYAGELADQKGIAFGDLPTVPVTHDVRTSTFNVNTPSGGFVMSPDPELLVAGLARPLEDRYGQKLVLGVKTPHA